jgi:hypothetical protein
MESDHGTAEGLVIILKVYLSRKRKQRRCMVSTDQPWVWKSGLILTVFKKLIWLQLNISEGPDGLHPMVLRQCAVELTKPTGNSL